MPTGGKVWVEVRKQEKALRRKMAFLDHRAQRKSEYYDSIVRCFWRF